MAKYRYLPGHRKIEFITLAISEGSDMTVPEHSLSAHTNIETDLGLDKPLDSQSFWIPARVNIMNLWRTKSTTIARCG